MERSLRARSAARRSCWRRHKLRVRAIAAGFLPVPEAGTSIRFPSLGRIVVEAGTSGRIVHPAVFGKAVDLGPLALGGVEPAHGVGTIIHVEIEVGIVARRNVDEARLSRNRRSSY